MATAAVAGIAARLCYRVLTSDPPGGARTWTRTNHRGEPVTLLEGAAVVIGGVAGAAMTTSLSSRGKIAMAVAGAGAAAFGCYDDLAGNGASRGLRGHLGALRAGELTTGVVKLAGIGATGAASALTAGSRDAMTDYLIDAALIAGGANLLNLFDLRPGRAVKVALGAGGLLAAAPGVGGAASVAPLAAAAALLPEDLGERAMLGDAGANGIGAMLGVAAAAMPRRARLAALGAVVGLTVASEFVSFTQVIERTGALRRLDMLGRRPPPVLNGQHAAPPPDVAPAARGAGAGVAERR